VTTISLVFLGHVDHGKSTILGHFLYQIGVIDERTKNQAEEEAEKNQMDKWKWAFLLDSLAEERARGKTSDIAFQPFSTDKRNFMLIDTPGHRDFVPATIRGATQADACILVVSAESGDLASGMKIGDERSPGGQTRELAIIGSVLGIENVIVAINKMDAIKYKETEFNKAVKEVMNLLKEVRSPWLQILTKESFIPISGWQGDNLTEKSDNMPWYNGATLYEALDNLSVEKITKQSTMRFLGQDVYDIPGLGTVINGRVIEGLLKSEQKVRLLPEGTEAEIRSLFTFQEEDISSLEKGSYGIVQLRGVEKDSIIEGAVLAPLDEDIKQIKEITARMLVLESTKKPLIPGKKLILHCGTANASITIEEIVEIQKQKKKRPSSTKVKIAFPGDIAILKISLDSSIVVEKFTDHPILGRVILRSMGDTIAVGIVTDFQ
jgi:elongation factor 1-alpha